MNVLVASPGAYSFRHALLGEAVYDDLLPGERVRLHAQYVAALQSGAARGTAAELARHARLAMDLDTALSRQHPGRQRGQPRRRPRRGGVPLPAGARAARRPEALRPGRRRPVEARRQRCRGADRPAATRSVRSR